eukprot:COSAG02_NODE_6017_length_3873_cov_5.501007_3_plen_167_part_00
MAALIHKKYRYRYFRPVYTGFRTSRILPNYGTLGPPIISRLVVLHHVWVNEWRIPLENWLLLLARQVRPCVAHPELGLGLRQRAYVGRREVRRLDCSFASTCGQSAVTAMRALPAAMGVLLVVLLVHQGALAERPAISIEKLGLQNRHTIVRPEVTHYLAPGVRGY